MKADVPDMMAGVLSAREPCVESVSLGGKMRTGERTT